MLATTQAELILTSAPEPSSAAPVALAPAEADLVAPAQNAPSSGSALPPELADTVWRGNQLGGGRAGFVSSGFPALDAEPVDGGWPVGCLIEVLQPQPSLLEWRLIPIHLRAEASPTCRVGFAVDGGQRALAACNVCNIIAKHMEDWTPLLGGLSTKSRDFR